MRTVIRSHKGTKSLVVSTDEHVISYIRAHDTVVLEVKPEGSVARVDREELRAALGVVRQPLLFSSGAHQFLNTQPWAVIEKSDEDDSETVDARFATMEEADEYVEAEAGGDSVLYVQYAPHGIDNVPLTNPGNPILADVRAGGTPGRKYNRADWWLTTLEEIDEADLRPYQRHALRVLRLWVRLVEERNPQLR